MIPLASLGQNSISATKTCWGGNGEIHGDSVTVGQTGNARVMDRDTGAAQVGRGTAAIMAVARIEWEASL